MTRLRGFRKRDVAGWLVALACSLVVGAVPAHAAHWTVPKLIEHATPHASACKVAPRWGRKQLECASFLVFRREPTLGRQAFLITGCETGGTYDPRSSDTPPYLGLGQFHPRTWARLPRWLSRHSVFSPPWVYRAMRYLRLQDGSWKQWPYCSRHAL